GRVATEPRPAAQRALQIVGDQLDGLPADQIPAVQEPHRPSRNSSSNSCLRRLRPRCSRTRWFPSVRASTAQTSSLLIPSTSRSSTTSRWRPGRPPPHTPPPAGCVAAPPPLPPAPLPPPRLAPPPAPP